MISNSGTSTLGLYDLKRQIDAFGGVDYFRPTLADGYLHNARVMLANGDIVKNTVDGNANDPNVDMTGWVKLGNIITVDSIAEMLSIPNPQTGVMVTTKSYHAGLNKSGKSYIYDATKSTINDGGLVINGWICVNYDYITPEMFGAKGDGDDADALLRWLNSGEPDIQLTTGASYYTSKPLPIPETVRRIRGNFAEITYDREQTTALESSLLQAHYRSSPITIERVSLKYTGTFDYGYSYNGRVCGIDINTLSGCSGVTIREVTASGFNWAGIAVGRFGSFSNPNSYIKNVLIENCHSHHNRVSGIWFGWVDDILLTGNRLEFNGKSGDIGTGYGCSGASDAYPKNVTVIANFANYNFRKGIDFHAGFNIIIKANQCRGNLMYGIALPIRNHGNSSFPLQPVGSVIVQGNIISDMIAVSGRIMNALSFTLDAPPGGAYPPESAGWKTVVKVLDNVVSNCRNSDKSDGALPLAINGCADVDLTVSGNEFDIGSGAYMFSLSFHPTIATHPSHKSTIHIKDNVCIMGEMPGMFRLNDIQDKTRLVVSGNTFRISQYNLVDGRAGLPLVALVKNIRFEDNDVNIANMPYFNTQMVQPYTPGGYCKVRGNTLNGEAYPEIFSYIKRHIAEFAPADNEFWGQGSKCEMLYANGARAVPLEYIVSASGYAVGNQWAANTAYAKGARVFSGASTYTATVAGTSGTVAITRAGVDGTVTWALLGSKAVFVPIYNAGYPA